MKQLIGVFYLMIACFSLGQEDPIWLHPNQGQWDHQIDYKVELNQGSMYINNSGFTYVLHNALAHDHAAVKNGQKPETVRCQVIKSEFIGASHTLTRKEGKQSNAYRNYYVSPDSTKWKSGIKSLEQVTYSSFYPGIDLQIESENGKLKYSFCVAPSFDPAIIRTNYSGASSLKLSNGNVVVGTEFGTITEEKPVAWTLHQGKKVKVAIEFVLKDGVLSYAFPDGYNQQDTLMIDPTLVFSTFTGSTMDNWGMSATPDTQGNLYAGGIVFDAGGSYPTTVGAFDVSFNGGQAYSYTFNGGTFSLSGFDVAITKFNALGTALIFSTFLGGSDNESIHSMVTDENDNLFVFGVTGSEDFPVTAGCVDATNNGGPYIATNELGFYGADIYISHFNAAGSALIGSTFIGGTETDGVVGGSLYYNYGDPFRGEIIVNNGFVYLASSTNSADFPTVNGAQPSLAGSQDAVVMKLNTALTNIVFSTYMGGSGIDSGNGIQLSSTGMIYVAGGTTSTNFPAPSGFDLSYNGGISDGYVARLTNVTGAVLSATYVGTSEYDQLFFVQLDNDDAVYVYGQTEGSVPISAGCYGVANSGQTVMKFSTTLQSQLWTTAVGAGTGHVEISPTAFLVSNCYDIYIAGWGGTINTSYSPGATSSTTFGFPATADAYQTGTNGSNFWIAVLDGDAAFLKYATFMGGTTSSYNHVDGGTSRFDKNGNIYHAVCGACGGANFGFTTTPGAWSTSNPSFNCNLAAFKFKLSTIEAVITDPDPLICLPDPVLFQNNSSNGNNFFWNFGDGQTSNLVNPSHVYAGPGQYTVTLMVTDTNQCYSPDSIEFIVNIGDFQGGVIDPDILVCPGQTAQLEAYGGAVYQWSPAAFLSNATIANPIATVTQSTLFTCIISDSCGIDTVQVQVTVSGGNVIASADTSICLGNSVPLFVQGVLNATWSPPSFLDNPNSLTPISTPLNTITYQITGQTIDGCSLNESVTIQVFFNPPIPVIPDTLKYCAGGSGTVTVSGATSYAWSPPTAITPLTGPTVTISAATEGYYYCDFTNVCGTVRDSIFISLVDPSIFAGDDTIVCPGEVAYMHAWGGVSYVWYPAVTALTANGSEVSVIAPNASTYKVIGSDQFGCIDSAYVVIDLFPKPFIQTNPDVYAIFGEPVPLSANSTTTGSYVWSPAEYLSCVVCDNPIAQPDRNFVYTVSYTDENGCSASDQVHIYYEPLIYVPNTFTPNGDNINEDFFALGVNIDDFTIDIFNRWGELIYTGDKLSKFWDGTYKGQNCQDGVYTWKIRYTEFQTDIVYELVGHVSLLR